MVLRLCVHVASGEAAGLEPSPIALHFFPKLSSHRTRYVVSGNGDDDISLFMPCFDIPVSLGNLLQRVTSIDYGFQLSRLYQSGEENKVFNLVTGTS